jgi:hypothetical protein
MLDRIDDECRRMLQVCGFTYDPTRDAYANDIEGRSVSVDAILAHTQLWVAQWITQTLPPG